MKSQTSLVKNILRVYARATDADISAGMSWYHNAHTIACNLDYHSTIGAGVIAAFSPMTSWKRNLELAASACSFEFLPGLKDPVKKARAILDGISPLDVLRGPKVRNFYRAILSSGVEGVVIDRHALSVALGRNATEKERNLSDKKYEIFAEAYRAAADRAGLRPADLQAVCWVTWRREKGIVD